ncbi:hypothetical protein RRF57_004829 [Xylaria bambusicola]|uniref:Uncharacterized protein n=1 Tax=Xylaria bambusicola TaxID=326684 RepID=A0AAN7UNU6_9PEZI
MSIVPREGVLRKLYQDAVDSIEYKSSAFWQIWLQRAFWEDNFIVVCEFPPDNSLRRVDIVVREYNQDHNTLTSIVYTESKKPNGSRREVEEQAADAARLAIEHDNLAGVYAMTTVGTRFRIWYMSAEAQVLEPLDETDEYIDADSEYASRIWGTIEFIKGEPPLRIAPVLPSQALLAAQQGPSIAPQGGVEDHDDESRTAETEERAPALVHVTKRVHTFGPNEFLFKDSRGKTRTTTKADWTMQTHNGNNVWVYQGSKMTYYTNQQIG